MEVRPIRAVVQSPLDLRKEEQVHFVGISILSRRFNLPYSEFLSSFFEWRAKDA